MCWTACVIPKFVTPGWVTTHLFGKSIFKILLNFPKPRITASCNGNAPPDKPVPAPLGITLIFSLWQYFKISLTSSVFSGSTTAKGVWVYAAAYTQTPLAVVLPENTDEVSEILKYCHKENIKVIPRGAGTGLSGGALPLQDAVILGLGKFNKILNIDFPNKCVVTQPGVTNLGITHAVQHKGFYYAPDPSSQLACSIGGNVAENSGGVHSLKYGTTTNNILGVEMVMMDGTICRFGGKALDQEGYDLMGLICGSEGLLGVVTEVTVKILKKPQVVKAALIGFPSIKEGGDAASEIISSGIVPAGMEIMDRALIEATDNFSKAGYPRDAELLLIVELDGTESEVNELLKKVSEISKKNNCSSLKLSKNEQERLKFWAQNFNLSCSFLLSFKLEQLFFLEISLTFFNNSFTSDSVPSSSTIKSNSASLGYPALLKLSVASINALSIISIPAGTIPLEIISDAASPPSLIEGKPINAALTTCGFFKIFTVTSVTTPNKPSDPQINPIKS